MGDVDNDIADAVARLLDFKAGTPLKRFITHIRFPRFKNLSTGTRIEFKFPVTALVGANGCGKTSVLHALYGAPERSSTSDYWFETSVDPIEHRNDDPQRFIYGHWLPRSTWLVSDGVVETRKARVKKEGNPEYWEPTKVTAGDEMEPMPSVGENVAFGGPKERVRSLDRWSAVKREVLFLNFRRELGAFDQFLWFGNLRRGVVHSKQEEIRRKSQVLRRAIVDGEHMHYGKKRVFETADVTAADLRIAESILGKRYTKAQILQHDLYGGMKGPTVMFHAEAGQYSDAFAGSGEIAVLNLVVKVRSQPKYSLILLDEPEVSLHPAAQKRLLHFLLNECRIKHHQVVFTTHSPHLIEGLPEMAIKVFTEDASGHFSVINSVHPMAAFHRLGATPPERIKILVEDRLAKGIVQLALSDFDKHDEAVFDIDYLPGGAQTYLALRIPTLMHRQDNTWILLDGDQHKGDVPDAKDIADNALDSEIKRLTGVDVKNIQFGPDGGASRQQQHGLLELKRDYLEFLRTRVRYLPRTCPEAIVMGAISPEVELSSASEAKTALRAYLERLSLRPSSAASDDQAVLLLAQQKQGNPDLAKIREILQEMLESLGFASKAKQEKQ